ncbi:S1 family peptidase [Candidatus Pelagadaptatus aseana]|uniref:S1 family peptidase n=1 Tax=Candidatus Pelagadaptatus aseana TaxID=3120508 RepID=UPI003C70384D
MLTGAFKVFCILSVSCLVQASDRCLETIRRADYLLLASASTSHHFSAVLIAPDLAITTAHGLPAGNDISLWQGNYKVEANLLALHWGMDIALLKLSSPLYGAVTLSDKPVALQTIIWASSFDHNANADIRRGEVMVSKRGELITTATLEPGGSGGALLVCNQGSEQPKLIGVLRAACLSVDPRGVWLARGWYLCINSYQNALSLYCREWSERY